MKIKKHTVPTVTYTLKVENQVVDTATVEEPLVFIFGVGSMIPGFESQLEGKEPGNEYAFSLQPQEAYGEYNPDAVVDLPLETFKVDGQIKEGMLTLGNVIPMQDQNGNPLRGKVKNVKEEQVTMDFNHELAGKELHFTGKIIEVREASSEEIDHGHVHGPGGHQH
jgi:FKBP-type peptidyl-prolyl cis-trans isomerase SlyD